MSQLHIRTVDMAEVVRVSSAIIVAVPLEPFVTKVEVRAGRGKREFGYPVHHYRIWEVLRHQPRYRSTGDHAPEEADMGELLLDSQIDVLPAGVARRYDLAEALRNRSYSVDRYASSLQDEKTERIVFLRRGGFLKQSVWFLAVQGAVESLEKREEVEALIKESEH